MADSNHIPRLGGFFKRNRHSVVLFLLLFIGIFVRSFLLGVIPPGLNQDEASIGYESFALLNYGIDRNGFHNPVHLISWGSGQNALYAYLSMPFVALFGLNPFSVRLVNSILGCVSLIIFYLLIRKIYDRQAALISLFFLVISPWHIMMSRWGLEANIFPFFFLLGVYLLVLFFDKAYFLLFSFFVFATALYSYGTSYFVVPLFLLFSFIYLVIHRKIRWNYFVGAGVIFILTALPIVLFLVINTFKLDSIKTTWFSIPRLTEAPRYETLSVFFGSNFFTNSYRHFADFLNWFVIYQRDGWPWNAIPMYGYMYLCSLPFMVFGIVRVIIENRNLRVFNQGFFILVWFFVSLLLGFVVEPNITRINIIFLPMIFFTSYGVIYFKDCALRFYTSLKLLYFLFFLSFLFNYFCDYPAKIGPLFYESFGDAINFAVDKSGDTGKIYITNRINQPYIYVLFYQKISPHIFLDDVIYSNDLGYGRAKSLGRFKFGFEGAKPDEEPIFVFHKTEEEMFKNIGYNIETFKDYQVAYKKK